MSKKSPRFTLKDLKEAGFVEYEPDKFIHKVRVQSGLEPRKKRKPKGKRTGWTDDCRNKREKIDEFMARVQHVLGLEVWAEFHFVIDRKWRFDYCIPEKKIAIEVEGGVHTGGRHTRGVGFTKDMEKYNAATSLGWILLRVVPSTLNTHATIELLKRTIS